MQLRLVCLVPESRIEVQTLTALTAHSRSVACPQGPVRCPGSMSLGSSDSYDIVGSARYIFPRYGNLAMSSENRVSCDRNGVLSSHADISAITGRRLYKRPTSPPPCALFPLPAHTGRAMASTAKRIGKKIIAHPEDGVPIISTTTYAKGLLKDPKQSVSPKAGVTDSPTLLTFATLGLDNQLSPQPISHHRVDCPI